MNPMFRSRMEILLQNKEAKLKNYRKKSEEMEEEEEEDWKEGKTSKIVLR